MRIAKQVAAAAAAIGFVAMAATAQAQADVQFTGTTTGCLAAGCTPTGTSTVNGLTFTGAAFNNTTVNGFAGFGSQNAFQNFGVFTTDGGSHSYSGTPFTLNIAFSQPSVSGSPATFFATLMGSVSSTGNGGANVGFGNNREQTFSFTDGTTGTSGTFLLHVNDVAVDGLNSAPVTGYIVTTTPEPSSMALLGTGLVGLLPMVRRKRKA